MAPLSKLTVGLIFYYMAYLFTSESVSEGHPDKVADQISDAVVDEFLAFDPDSKVACETLVTTGQVVLAGEVKSRVYVDLQEIARNVINRIGYTVPSISLTETHAESSAQYMNRVPT